MCSVVETQPITVPAAAAGASGADDSSVPTSAATGSYAGAVKTDQSDFDDDQVDM